MPQAEGCAPCTESDRPREEQCGAPDRHDVSEEWLLLDEKIAQLEKAVEAVPLLGEGWESSCVHHAVKERAVQVIEESREWQTKNPEPTEEQLSDVLESLKQECGPLEEKTAPLQDLLRKLHQLEAEEKMRAEGTWVGECLECLCDGVEWLEALATGSPTVW